MLLFRHRTAMFAFRGVARRLIPLWSARPDELNRAAVMKFPRAGRLLQQSPPCSARRWEQTTRTTRWANSFRTWLF